MLIERKLLDVPVLYLSRFILQEKSAYYEGLLAVTEQGAWEPWLLYMLRGIETTAQSTRERIEAIRGLLDEWIERARREIPKIYSKDLMEAVFRLPYSKAQFLEELGIGSRNTAAKYLRALVDLGLLKLINRGRETYYLNEPFYQVLTHE